ncbi:S8 family serine peptidase [Cecembia calidifontis]|uniref:Putative secreted protein (Por secretion system target) n=1 Tax=Cecembia calidifontis TaxID=1187080 RepID=A0A4Q7PBX8_9BACT|nr:S8 family serine peptidase [Cecembia calidifontis]RZS97080.1 putative secreted protein (Por secretion system target) [Cecembia calidifontis]
MANYKTLLIVLFFLFFGFSANAQNRYAIHYRYKPQEMFSLDNPAGYLTISSIERRLRQRITLDSLDLPVSEKYIKSIIPLVDQVLYHSKWLNASVVIANEENLEKIQSLDFVSSVEFVARGFVPEGRQLQAVNARSGMKANKKKNASTAEAPFDFQNGLLGIQEMHELGYTGKGITIAIFDAGFPGVDQIPAFSHLFENNQIIGTRDFVHVWNKNVFSKNQHGTNVLSLMASNDPDLLVAGAPDAHYILCITEEVPTEFRIEEYNWIKAAEYADSLGVDIINSSLGYWDFDDPGMDYSLEDMDGETAVISKGATIAANKGILVVTSAGNYGNRGERSITAPSDAKGILSVGATNMGMDRASFSSQGPTADGRIKPEVSTFGEQVWLIRSTGNLGRSSGTSFSAPQIAAFAAGLWQARPEWTKEKLIEEILKSSSQAEDPDNWLGYGIPNFAKAYYGPVLGGITVEEQEWKIYPNPLKGSELFIQFGNSEQGEFALLDLKGRVMKQASLSRGSLRDPFEVEIPELPSGIYIVEVQSGSDIKRTKLMKW